MQHLMNATLSIILPVAIHKLILHTIWCTGAARLPLAYLAEVQAAEASINATTDPLLAVQAPLELSPYVALSDSESDITGS